MAVEENVWVSVNHYHMTTHVLKVERSSMSVIQHRWRTPLLSLSPHRSEGAPRQEECWRLERHRGMTINFTCLILYGNTWASKPALQNSLLIKTISFKRTIIRVFVSNMDVGGCSEKSTTLPKVCKINLRSCDFVCFCQIFLWYSDFFLWNLE